MELGEWAAIATIAGTAIVILGGVVRWLFWRGGPVKKVQETRPPPAEPPAPPSSGPWGLGEAVARAGVVVARGVMRAEGFRDRQGELARFAQLMAEGRGVIWVTGPAQAGKSWLVSRCVRDNGLEARAGRFELRGGADVQGFFEGVNGFLRQRGENRFDAACRNAQLDVAGKAAALVSVLRRDRWVLVVDSFEDCIEVDGWRQVVEMMQEELEQSVVVIGSRVMPEWGDRRAELALGAMDEAEGKGMLEEVGVSGDDADELFERTGGLPGALEVAGALAAERGAADVLRDVKGAAGEIGEKLLADTFEAAGEGAKRLWAGLCLLPGPVMRQTAEALCERDDFGEAWSELVRRKLLEPGEERAELHPLARTVGEARLRGMVEWEEECGRRVAGFCAKFAEEKAEDRAAVEGELENVLAAARLAFRYEEWEGLWAMGYALWEPLMYAGRWIAREELLRLCYEAAKRAGDKRRRGDFAHNLAMAYQDRGDLGKAEPLYRESLDIEREVRNRPGIAQSLHQLGMVAQDRGKLDEAEGLYRESLEMKREVGNRPGEAETLHQLGMVAQDRGKLEEAEGLYNQSLEIEREVGDRPGEAVSLHQLGRLEEERRRLKEALSLMEQALRMFEEMGMAEQETARRSVERLKRRLAEES